MMGTAFIATHEAFAHDFHKARIVSAGMDDTVHTSDFHINWPAGAAVRQGAAHGARTRTDDLSRRRIHERARPRGLALFSCPLLQAHWRLP